MAPTGAGETADEHGVESGPLDQQRAQCIVGAGNDEQSPLRDGSVERLAKTSSTAHGYLLVAGSGRLCMIGRPGGPTKLMIAAESLTDPLSVSRRASEPAIFDGLSVTGPRAECSI